MPITIKVKGDLLDELDETLKLELLNNNDVVVRSATGTIKNDDNNSKLSINDATADEPGTMKFTVTLAPASGREVKVNWGTADGTATAPGDYTSGSGQLTFAPGETTKTIDIAVAGDTTNEENETLKVNALQPDRRTARQPRSMRSATEPSLTRTHRRHFRSATRPRARAWARTSPSRSRAPRFGR